MAHASSRFRRPRSLKWRWGLRLACLGIAGVVVSVAVAWGVAFDGSPGARLVSNWSIIVVSGTSPPLTATRTAAFGTERFEVCWSPASFQGATSGELPGWVRQPTPPFAWGRASVSQSFGWPVAAMRGHESIVHRAVNNYSTAPDGYAEFVALGRPRWLPLRIIPLGLLVDGFVYAALIAAITVGVVAVSRALQPRPGACASCRYDLTGNTTGVCPECGHQDLRRAEART
jgi:hypothetical protein